MSITVGGFTFNRLTAQPFGYSVAEATRGFAVRQWSISGLVTPSEWLDLLGVYDTWRGLRILEPDSLVSGSVGTTVNFSGDGPGGQTWSNIDCWFASAPEAEQVGVYLSISFELVDAEESLEIAQIIEEEGESSDNVDFGTITIGGVTLQLQQPVDSYLSTPSVELTSTGTHFISGPLVVSKVKDVVGTTNLTGWNSIRAWYEQQIVAVPLTGSYFPISSPTASAAIELVSGVKSTVYTVSIQLVEIL